MLQSAGFEEDFVGANALGDFWGQILLGVSRLRLDL
jgi:hypothetical protein